MHASGVGINEASSQRERILAMDFVMDKNRSRGSFVLYDSVSIHYAKRFFEEEVQHSFVQVGWQVPL